MQIDPSNACGIYAFVNHELSRVYIGQTLTTFTRRWRSHIQDLNTGRHVNVELMQDWQALGADAFQFSILRAFQPNLGKLGVRYPMNDLEFYYIYTSESWLYNTVQPRSYYRPEPALWKFLDPYRL